MCISSCAVLSSGLLKGAMVGAWQIGGDIAGGRLGAAGVRGGLVVQARVTLSWQACVWLLNPNVLGV